MMDELVKNGESSTRYSEGAAGSEDSLRDAETAQGTRLSARRGDGSNDGTTSGDRVAATQIIPHDWNHYAPLPLHPSMDLVSLVNLRPQFDRFVRPYLPLHILRPDLHPPPNKDEQVDDQVDAGSGAKKKKKKDGNQRRLEKGYEGLIEECIDPTPLPASDSLRSLLYGPPAHEIQEIQVRPFEGEAWKVACRLEVGRTKGYDGGQKEGVEAAEAKRKRKKAKKSASLQPTALPSSASPAPGSPFPLYPPHGANYGPGTPRDGPLRINLKVPGTPSYVTPQQQGVKRGRSQSRGPSVSRGTSPAGEVRKREGSAAPNGIRPMSAEPHVHDTVPRHSHPQDNTHSQQGQPQQYVSQQQRQYQQPAAIRR